jgi:selenocysteine-specific elongation factor
MSPPTRRLLAGTAGHVDHGKTQLIRALTGIDCDRWTQEKERGITIDLGFAHFEDGDAQVGFIDVPGHERFLHNALAGLGGLDLLLLVVAADEGVRPQTREHVAICELLGVPEALVVLTKTDLVAEALCDLVEIEVGELLAPTRFRGAATLRTSSLDGTGIAALRERLTELASADRRASRREFPFRMPIDRAFHLKGQGVIVTGTVAAGRLTAGEAVAVLPHGDSVRVRSLQSHGEKRDELLPGERAAVQLSGIDLERLARGMTLAAPGSLGASRRLCARLRLLEEVPPWTGWTDIRLFIGSDESPARARPLAPATLSPGGEGSVEIRTARPVVAARGDRVVVRRPSPAHTLGGGEILDPAWLRPRAAALPEGLAAAGGADLDIVRWWLRSAGWRALSAGDVAPRLGRHTGAAAELLRALERDGQAVRFELGPRSGSEADRWLAATAYRRLSERAAAILAAGLKEDRFRHGMAQAEFVHRLVPRAAPELADAYLQALTRHKVVSIAEGRVHPPGRGTDLSQEDSRLAVAVVEAFDRAGLKPPSPAEVQEALGAKRQILDGLLRALVRRGSLVQLPGGLILSARAVESLRAELRATGWQRFSVPQFKERFGLSRKWAIPLLEHLDSTGSTRRAGDERIVLRSTPPVA